MEEITVSTSRKVEMVDITREVEEVVEKSGVKEGICFIYCPHTTAALTLNENADPDVALDITQAFEALIPSLDFKHVEGNSPSHIQSSIMGSTLNLFIINGKLKLGTWQGVYFCEFDGPRHRKIWVKIMEG